MPYRLAQVAIDSGSRFAPFGDRPDDQRLAAAHVARREDSRDARHVIRIRMDVPAEIELHAELLDESMLYGSREAHRKQHQIAIEREFGSRDGLELRRA